MENEFSVWIFFPDGSHIDEGRFLKDQDAVQLAYEVTKRPAAQAGIIKRVIITDGGDCTCFEWQFGKGVTYPPRE